MYSKYGIVYNTTAILNLSFRRFDSFHNYIYSCSFAPRKKRKVYKYIQYLHTFFLKKKKTRIPKSFSPVYVKKYPLITNQINQPKENNTPPPRIFLHILPKRTPRKELDDEDVFYSENLILHFSYHSCHMVLLLYAYIYIFDPLPPSILTNRPTDQPINRTTPLVRVERGCFKGGQKKERKWAGEGVGVRERIT